MLWNAFSDGGKPIACGWITYEFGVTGRWCPPSWASLWVIQYPIKAKRVADAMMKMVKFDIAALEAARDAG